MPASESQQHEGFIPLWTAAHQRVLAFILTLVPDLAEAEDILQNTGLVVWQKFQEYEPGTDFAAWSCRVAYLEVCNNRRVKSHSKVLFDDEVLQFIADEAIEQQQHADLRMDALARCLEGLGPEQRKLILLRYGRTGSVVDIARSQGRTIHATYKALARIRAALFDCVSRRLAQEGVR